MSVIVKVSTMIVRRSLNEHLRMRCRSHLFICRTLFYKCKFRHDRCPHIFVVLRTKMNTEVHYYLPPQLSQLFSVTVT